MNASASLAKAVLERSGAFADQLRHVADGDTPVPNLDWSVTELGRHVAGLPQFWTGQHAAGAIFERPTDFAAFSQAMQGYVHESEPAAIADRLEVEFGAFVDRMRADPQQRWLYGIRVNPADLFGLGLNELILHGRDLAAVTSGRAPQHTNVEALAAVDALMRTTPVFVDEAKALAQPDGVYHVRFRGGQSYTWTKAGPNLEITLGKPVKADATLVADPTTFLLSALGRISQVRAGLSGKMVSYGRKPWRFLGLANIAVEGV